MTSNIRRAVFGASFAPDDVARYRWLWLLEVALWRWPAGPKA